ncbi:hypothetical protein ES332_D08G022400v1 [Gossypium tomentosum]|uniref:non-specific serine/threonine protein kinase n=1 Tax=Gossypium tomentosum TaxID=34277 RepID=A0A5D2JR39_GOSTO|nr:hypothetical protein ES332_D08G022400v1 [Gossypium tomentosum]
MGICISSNKQKLNQLKHGQSRRKKSPEIRTETQGSNEIKTQTVVPLTPARDVKDLRQNPGYDNVCIFTYEETRLATNEFRPDHIIGEGGFGVVYKGVIDEKVKPGYPTTVVAVKELNPDGFQGDREWLAEVNYLGQFSHPNLVKLIGYCCEGDHRLLVYEYMESGSLERHLFRSHLTARSDVYGFGVVLLELLIGRRVMDKGKIGPECNLIEWARPLLHHKKKLIKILDPKMEGQFSPRSALKVAHLAYLCLSENPKGRPIMSQVVECLETIQVKDINQEEALLLKGSRHGVGTINEVPRKSPRTTTRKRNPNRSESYKDGCKQRNEPGKGRSQSEPPTKVHLSEPSSSEAEDKVENVAEVSSKRIT